MFRAVYALLAISVLFLQLGIHQSYAQEGSIDRSLTLQVTDTRTGIVRTQVWDLSAYTFEQVIVLDVPDYRVDKIDRIYGTDSLSFTLDRKVISGEWLSFEVDLIGTPIVGKRLRVQFI